jgi:WhiB family redox-sensing transcriptional regulator
MQGACYGRFDIEWATTENRAQINAAKQVCATCPVMRMCRTYGLTAGLDDWGVWGGLTRPERQKVAAARKTGTESVA